MSNEDVECKQACEVEGCENEIDVDRNYAMHIHPLLIATLYLKREFEGLLDTPIGEMEQEVLSEIFDHIIDEKDKAKEEFFESVLDYQLTIIRRVFEALMDKE